MSNKTQVVKSFTLLLSLLLFSCGDSFEPYFQYDTLVHYQSGISSEEISDLYSNAHTKTDAIKHHVLTQYLPKNLKDTAFLGYMHDIGFKKPLVSPDKFPAIDSIFRVKKSDNLETILCENEFRNVLVFKKKEKIKGIAKICFECEKSHIVGTNKNSSRFGKEDNDFAKLRKILSE